MDLTGKQRRQGEVYRSKEKQMILNALCCFNKTMNVSAAAKETSNALGCSARIVYSLRTQQGMLKSLPKKKPKREDAYDEVCGDVYEKWYTEQLLAFLPPNSAIAIDNALHHIRKIQRIPTSNWKKDDIRFWLESKHVSAE
ncbi:hypothetical protein Trydic_g1179 [Trypoxylus dichotomus]